MKSFMFDKEIFKKKFVNGNTLRNYAKSRASGCYSIYPNNADNGGVYKEYKPKELLADTIRCLRGEAVTEAKITDLNSKLLIEIENNVTVNEPYLINVFKDVISSFYFETNDDLKSRSLSLLKYQSSNTKKEFGKNFGRFMVDVFFDEETKKKLIETLNKDSNVLDDIVSNAYINLKVLESLKKDKEYTRIFSRELNPLFEIMNDDFRAAMDNISDVSVELEFLLTYYLFIYLSRIALYMEDDLNNNEIRNKKVYFKLAKESVSEDRDCVAHGWRAIERKTKKIFQHMIVLNMLNCHDSAVEYATYSEFYNYYKTHLEARIQMDDAIDYIIHQYTIEYKHDTDDVGNNVNFNEVKKEYIGKESAEEKYVKKIQYLYNCVSFQLDEKKSRQEVVSYSASNYNHILKMRFVKTWGQMGNMMIISNEDLILMIQVCQKTSNKMNSERGILINDLFDEFEKRNLYLDGKSRQYVIDYLIDINLIESKCDSEEAQYVKRIQ